MIRKAHKKVLKKKGIKEDLASGRPAKKPVSSNLLKQRARDNEKALKSGFMKLTPKERAKEAKRFLEDKNWPRPFSKSERDEFLEKGPKGKHKVSSDTKKTIDQISKDKEDRKKAINKSTRRGRLPESAPAAGDVDKKTMGQINRRIDKEMKKKGIKTNWMKGVKEAKKPTVHFKGEDKLKTVKIKYNKPIKTKFPGTVIIFCNMPPIKEFPAFTSLIKFIVGNLVEILGEELKAVATGHENVFYFGDKITLSGWIEKFQLKIKKEDFFSDGMHPSKLTYQIWAKYIAREIFRTEKIKNALQQSV